MHPLEVYYLNEAGRGLIHSGVDPFYADPLYLQCGQSIGNFFGSPFRRVRNLLWRGIKAVGRETLRTEGMFLTDIAENKLPEVGPKRYRV